MKDMQASVVKLRADAAEAALISESSTDSQKRELFSRLAEHFTVLANEVEAALSAQIGGEEAV
jgi:hypothetical protein